MGEYLCQLYMRQGNDNQIQGVQKTKLPKINGSMKKWANELKNGQMKGISPKWLKNT
jgi:hypothetical protein